MIEAYPLAWPVGWKRSKVRRHARYQVSFAKARNELIRELSLMGVPDYNIIISSNVPTRRDGLPYANQREPNDPGIAVYWSKNREQHVIACDAWSLVRDNLRACGLAIQGLRLIQRTEASEILDRAFSGFAALPESTTRHWRDVLGLPEHPPPTKSDVLARYRDLVMANHPDRGGRTEVMAEINTARDEALREVADA